MAKQNDLTKILLVAAWIVALGVLGRGAWRYLGTTQHKGREKGAEQSYTETDLKEGGETAETRDGVLVLSPKLKVKLQVEQVPQVLKRPVKKVEMSTLDAFEAQNLIREQYFEELDDYIFYVVTPRGDVSDYALVVSAVDAYKLWFADQQLSQLDRKKYNRGCDIVRGTGIRGKYYIDCKYDVPREGMTEGYVYTDRLCLLKAEGGYLVSEVLLAAVSEVKNGCGVFD